MRKASDKTYISKR
jgi:23S rRNA maturation-related 3'-5' exoribonuclease YhaM